MTTAKTGAGIQPAGTSPAGYGTPTLATVSEGSAMIDEYGHLVGSRKIDSVTKQYVFNSDGFIQGENDVRHLVKLCIMTVRGSSVWPGGLRPLSGVIGQNYKSKIEGALREALYGLTNGPTPLISVEAVQIDRIKPDVVKINLLYKDLLTNLINSIEVG